MNRFKYKTQLSSNGARNTLPIFLFLANYCNFTFPKKEKNYARKQDKKLRKGGPEKHADGLA